MFLCVFYVYSYVDHCACNFSVHIIYLLLSTLSCIVLYERCYTNKVLLIMYYIPNFNGDEKQEKWQLTSRIIHSASLTLKKSRTCRGAINEQLCNLSFEKLYFWNYHALPQARVVCQDAGETRNVCLLNPTKPHCSGRYPCAYCTYFPTRFYRGGHGSVSPVIL